jgi:hypothetical protein
VATKKANNSTFAKQNDSTLNSTSKTSSQLFQQSSTQRANTKKIDESIREDEEHDETAADISTTSNRTIITRRNSPRIDRSVAKLVETSSAVKKATNENTKDERDQETLKSIKLKELKVVVDKLSEKVIDKFNSKNETSQDSEIIDESLTDSPNNNESRRQSLRSSSTRRSHSAITKSDSSQEPPVKMARGNSSKDVSNASLTPTSTQSKISSTTNKEVTKKPTIIVRTSARSKASPSEVSPGVQNKLANTRSSSTKTTSASAKVSVNNERTTRSSSSKPTIIRQSNRKSK